MFKRMIESWKQEWLKTNKEALQTQFRYEIDDVRQTLDNTLNECKTKLSKLEETMRFKELELNLKNTEFEELSKRFDERKVVLAQKHEELNQHIKIIEAKAAPSEVWTSAFSLGFSKAWDMMLPIMSDGVSNMRKYIEDKAIQDTLGRMNGHNKKNH